VFESYKPFNGQGGSRLLLLTVHVLRACCETRSGGDERASVFRSKIQQALRLDDQLKNLMVESNVQPKAFFYRAEASAGGEILHAHTTKDNTKKTFSRFAILIHQE